MTTDDTAAMLSRPTEEQQRGDDIVSREALQQYGFSSQVRHRLITLSENATYHVEDPGTGRTGILRVHRQNYHSRNAIESELDWLDAVRRDTTVSTSVSVATAQGERVHVARVDGVERYTVLFEVMPGIEPEGDDVNEASFRVLGAITAQLHEHARGWERPSGFERFSWDWEHTLGDTPRWGSWCDGFGITDSDLDLFSRAASLIEQRLTDYGTGPDRYGLVHADLRLANLLVHDAGVNVIDFDDCGDSWFMYDFGTAVSFLEDDPRLPDWQRAWVAGYRSVADLSALDEAMLATFVMLRRLLLVAWMGSHSHSKECQAQGDSFTAGTRTLAAAYLRSDGAQLF